MKRAALGRRHAGRLHRRGREARRPGRRSACPGDGAARRVGAARGHPARRIGGRPRADRPGDLRVARLRRHVPAALPARHARRRQDRGDGAGSTRCRSARRRFPTGGFADASSCSTRSTSTSSRTRTRSALLELFEPDEVVLFGVATDICDDAAIKGLPQARLRRHVRRGRVVRHRRRAIAGLHRRLARRWRSHRHRRRRRLVTGSIHHVGIAVDDLDAAIARWTALFGATLEHRERVEDQGVEAASLRLGELAHRAPRPARRRHTGRQVPREARPGCPPRRVRDRRRRRRARPAEGRRGRADRRDAAPRDVRSPGRVRPPGGDRRRSGRVRRQ